MKIGRLFSILFAFFLVSAIIEPALGWEFQIPGTDQDTPKSLEGLVTENVQGIGIIFGVFPKPKWTYNGDEWKIAADQWKSSGNYEDALHGYDKALENYGLALNDKEVEWQTKDAKYNKWPLARSQSDMKSDDTFLTGKTEMTPFVKENIRHILASKEIIYKKKGENDKALDCLNTLLTDDPTSYNLLKEKADILNKMGRTAEAAEVQKEADKYKSEPETESASPDLLLIIGAIAGIFLLFKKKRS